MVESMTAAGIVIRQASSPADMESARALFLEYAAWLEIDLCFQGFTAEVANLPGAYAPPNGRLLLAAGPDGIIGCVALRPLPGDVTGASGELKRLWVRPAGRGQRVGHHLSRAALGAARDIGYRHVKLDTLPQRMPAAVALYRTLGFTECAPYYDSPISGSLYMECVL